MRLAGEGEQPLGQVSCTPTCLIYESNGLCLLFIEAAHFQKLGSALDDHELVVEVVCNAASQLAHCFERTRARVAFLLTLLDGHVAGIAEHAKGPAIWSAQDGRLDRQIDLGAITADQDVLYLPLRCIRLDDFKKRSLHPQSVFGLDVIEKVPLLAHSGINCDTKPVGPVRSDPEGIGLEIAIPEHVADGVGDDPEPFLRCLERVHGISQLADIGTGADDPERLAGLVAHDKAAYGRTTLRTIRAVKPVIDGKAFLAGFDSVERHASQKVMICFHRADSA